MCFDVRALACVEHLPRTRGIPRNFFRELARALIHSLTHSLTHSYFEFPDISTFQFYIFHFFHSLTLPLFPKCSRVQILLSQFSKRCITNRAVSK